MTNTRDNRNVILNDSSVEAANRNIFRIDHENKQT